MNTRKDFCVYTHNDNLGNVKYIGSGSISRANKTQAKSNRGKKYQTFVEKFGKLNVVIISKNLSKIESLQLESDLYDQHQHESLLNIRKPSKVKPIPSQEQLDSLFQYNEDSPSCLRWKVSKGTAKVNSVAGRKNKQGYWQVQMNNKLYLVQRIIITLHCISLSTEQVVDHIDHDPSNNKINNLRVVSQAQNSRNLCFDRKIRKFPVGISFNSVDNLFIASVRDPSSQTASGQSKQIYKIFSVKTYGYDKALELAIKARVSLLLELEKRLNINYSQSHKEVYVN